jgi:hypothetical protein
MFPAPSSIHNRSDHSMSKHIVTFIGDHSAAGAKKGHANPDTITVFGLTFEIDEPTPVNFESPEGQKILAKLRGNSHFKIEDAPTEKAKPDSKGKGEKKPDADA